MPVNLAQKPEEQDGDIIGFRRGRGGGVYPVREKDTEKLPTVGGEKAKNTREITEELHKRHGIAKTIFKIRDNVTFDNFTKRGIISGFTGDSITIYTEDKKTISTHKDDVFKVAELIGDIHWDAMTIKKRYDICVKSNINPVNVDRNWYFLDFNVRNHILKVTGPAGYEGNGGVSTNSTGVYNPVHSDKSVEERIKEEETKPQHNPTVADQKPEEKKPKTYSITEVSSDTTGDAPNMAMSQNKPKTEQKPEMKQPEEKSNPEEQKSGY